MIGFMLLLQGRVVMGKHKKDWQPGFFAFTFKNGDWSPLSELATSYMGFRDALELTVIMSQLRKHHKFFLRYKYIYLTHKESKARSGLSPAYQRAGFKNLLRLGLVKMVGKLRDKRTPTFWVNDNGFWIFAYVLNRYRNETMEKLKLEYLGQFQEYGNDLYQKLLGEGRPLKLFKKFIKKMESCRRIDLTNDKYDKELESFYLRLVRYCEKN